MTSILKEFVLLLELPFKVRELANQGYAHFRFDTVKGDPKRIELRAWKEVKVKRGFECAVCGNSFNNPNALMVHQQFHPKKEERAIAA